MNEKYTMSITLNVRFRSEPYTFGNQTVLISKEWYERQRAAFITWYTSLLSENDLE